ncbi:MAG: tRNA lysidine(34) synthetase TilS [Bacteroidetes bacterium]|nr:tRNA lysidine(34) synthetase TilS [Bacteroidota bacterium]
MLKDLESNISKNQLFNREHSLLLAISGGVDSVVLAYLLKEGNYNFTLAHCNFNLRGKDSEKDEKFCRQLAEELGVQIFVKAVDVKKYCKEHGVSVQMAARDLRYDWFKKLMKQENLDRLLTAHHANDIVETVILNLLRGTGIKGMKGIPEKNGKTVRPLLNITREEIEKFAKKQKIKFRTDKSNLENKYERNFLRNKVVPLLKKINPELEQTFFKNSLRFSNESAIISDYIEQRLNVLVSTKGDSIHANRTKLAAEAHLETLLHHWLSPLNFSETQQQNIISLLGKKSGETKVFLSGQQKLIIERDELIITPNTAKEFPEIRLKDLASLKKQSILSFSKEKKFYLPQKNELYLSETQLQFPLTIRQRKDGDKFKPFGMKGFKLISDFLKDEKISTVNKNKLRLLVNGNGDIIWVMGYRSDERYRVDPSAKTFIKLTLTE